MKQYAKKGSRLFVLLSLLFSVSACEDFFEQESKSIIYADQDHLTEWSDSVSSLVGILNKLQAVADRTILLGEVRADLVNITPDADADLRDLANFAANDSNVYNRPADYYAIINNCNYYIQKVDSLQKNNRSEYVFMKEYAAIKGIRAWTYLQLVLNYGSVPFYTDPILTKDEAERQYDRKELADICQYFLADLATLPAEFDRSYPGLNHSSFPVSDARLLFFPLNLLRGELSLWAGNYREAALYYAKYLTDRYGTNTAYPTGVDIPMWRPGTTQWIIPSYWGNYGRGPVNNFFSNEDYGRNGAPGELITMIPSNTQRANGNYSELVDLFNSTTDNNQKFSITPSERLQEISAAQVFCALNSNGTSVVTPPSGLSNHYNGDLRLGSVWTEGETNDALTNERVETQYIGKYSTLASRNNVHIYRRQMVYLRLAEALNLAGYPHLGFAILSEGLTNAVISREYITHYYNDADSTYLSQFNFPVGSGYYRQVTTDDIVQGHTSNNTIGMHTRGSGWTPMNEAYRMPHDTICYFDTIPATYAEVEQYLLDVDENKRAQLLAEQQQFVDSLIINEGALEFSFEGTRFYDLMRYALRQPNPEQTMADFVYARRGEANRAEVEAELNARLSDRRNWYLRWKGQIGY